MSDDDLKRIFTYHAPTPGRVKRHQTVRVSGLDLARIINEECPDCREKSLAITYLQTSVMFANAALAIHGKEENDAGS